MRFFLLSSLLLLAIFSHSDKLFAEEIAKKQLDTLIIVSCAGKTGSSTLERSFKAFDLETYRYHCIPEDAYSYILDRAKDTNVLLIDSTRDPIARKISEYFHHLSRNLHLSQQTILSKYKKDRLKLLQDIQRKLDKEISKGYHCGFKNWRKLNYDCLKDGIFDFKKKYQLKKIGNLYFVNLRFDDIANWQKIIRSIDIPINLSNFKIVAANKSENKWYYEIYKDFLEYFTITQQDFDAISSKYSVELSHFYNDQEINKFINKWKPHIRR